MKIIRISSTWCPSCIITYKDYKKIKKEFSDIEYIEYDYDEDLEIVQSYNIGKIIPVLILLDSSDNEIIRIIGEKNYEEISNIIKENLK